MNADCIRVVNDDSLPKVARPLDMSTTNIAEDMVHSVQELTISCPSVRPYSAPLDFPNGYVNSSLYSNPTAIMQAPVFSNNPIRGLDPMSSNIHLSSNTNGNTGSMQAPGFSNIPARGLDFTSHPVDPMMYEDAVTIMQAPGFSNSAASGLDVVSPGNTYLSNIAALEAPSVGSAYYS